LNRLPGIWITINRSLFDAEYGVDSVTSTDAAQTSKRWTPIVTLAMVVGATFWIWHRGSSVSHQPDPAIRLYEDSKYDEALAAAETFLRSSPKHPVALAIAGLSAFQQRDFQTSEVYLANLPPPTGGSYIYHAWLARAEIAISQGRIDRAVADLSIVLEYLPQDAFVLRRLAKLSAGTANTTHAVSLLRELVDLGHASAEELMVLAANGEDLWSLDKVRRLRELSPTDRHLLWAEWKHLRIRQRHDATLELLDEALTTYPDDADFQVARLELAGIQSAADLEGLEGATASAAFWLLLSRHLESTDFGSSIGCAIRAVEADRFEQDTHQWLAESLRKSSREDLARLHQKQAEKLNALFELCRRRNVFAKGAVTQVVDLLESLGRYPEAVAWCRMALRNEPESQWASDRLTALVDKSSDESNELPAASVRRLAAASVRRLAAKTVLDATPSDVIRLAMSRMEEDKPAIDSQLASRDESIRLVDVAADVGLDAKFYNGANARERGRYMHEFTGGGVGVLDVDGDTWPDLFFPQGADQPNGSGSVPSRVSDELHRNIRGVHFESIAELAGITDAEFGQGVAIGDLNSDGFDDIYVANVSRNVMWINQGDGTFLQQELPEHESAWTISAAILDVNGDSIADVYDVNYVTGDGVFERLCDHEGEQRICSPTDFAAAQDELWLGNGDGTFRRGTIETGLDQHSGRGMGIVAGNILGNGGRQLVVANDESANFFLEYDSTGQLTDSAHVRGLAFGRDGTAQGSMGIAVGRLTPRHQTDLFITNYYGELNCFHEQTPQGFFIDSIGATQLEHPGRPMLGFGTQFLDVDADGDDDLFVANGHLDDFAHMSIPYHMKAQLFVNDKGQFRELPENSSTYLTEKTLGRAVARLDWNRDGAMDLCVTHLDRQVALLENRSQHDKPSVMLKWSAVSGHRDAVGTTVLCTPLMNGEADTESAFSVPILAGDGYECSNERIIHLVLPAAASGLRIRGPGVDLEWIPQHDSSDLLKIVEGDSRLWSIAR